VSYSERIGRVAFLGLVSVMVIAFLGSIFLLLYSLPIRNIAPRHLWSLLESTLFIGVAGLLPVLMYAVPIYTAYLSFSSFRLIYVLVLAALPGFGLLLLDSLIWPHFLMFGLGVALTMEVVSRRWPARFGRDTA